MMLSKRNFLLWGLLFRFLVEFRGCKLNMHLSVLSCLKTSRYGWPEPMVDQSSEPGGGNSGVGGVNQFSGGENELYTGSLKNGWLEDPYHPCCLIFMVYVGNIYVPYMDAVEDDVYIPWNIHSELRPWRWDWIFWGRLGLFWGANC